MYSSGGYDLNSTQKSKASKASRAPNSVKKQTHVKPLVELPPFPIDLVQMKNRNRKLLASLNTKKRFKDFEYKNYDSTDSDLYEEEDYLKIQKEDIEAEIDFLKKRRLERRHEVKLEILAYKKKEHEALTRRGGRMVSHSQQASKAPTPKRAI